MEAIFDPEFKKINKIASIWVIVICGDHKYNYDVIVELFERC